MDRDTARDIVAEFGVAEGDQFEYGSDAAPSMLMTITSITHNSAGVEEIEYTLEANDKTVDDWADPADFAGMIKSELLTRAGGDEEGDEDEGEDGDDEPELVTDGGQVVDDDGNTVDDYPDVADENEHLVGLDEWGAWYYDGVMGRLHNYKRDPGAGETPLTETDGACEELCGDELADRLADLDVLTPRGYELLYEHGDTEAVVNALIRHELSPGQAWAYYGVRILGNSRNAWSSRCGYSDHSAVSEPLRKAEAKLGL